MNKIQSVPFSRRTTEALGRNGVMQVAGISMLLLPRARTVVLEPVHSRGRVGRCFIEIPLEDLDQVMKGLDQIRAELKNAKAAC